MLLTNLVAVGVVAVMSLSLVGCDGSAEEELTITRGVYVANQGNFSDGNGSITVYDPDTQASSTMVDDAGSTVQSATISDGNLYLMSNTGGRIDVYSLETGAAVGQITGLASPRYMAVGPTKIGYV